MVTREVLAVSTAALIAALPLSAAPKDAPPLLTSQQREVDTLAVSLLSEPAVKAARAAAIKHWQQLRAAGLDDGKAQLEGAIDEAVYIAVRAVAADDPAHPKVVWTEAPSYTIGTLHVPGSRLGGDNPDRIYRSVAVNPSYSYEIRGHRNAQPSLDDFSFEAILPPSVTGQTQFSLSSKDVDVAKDGTFRITADSTPPNGRRNHLYLPPGTAALLLRDTLADWSSQLPNELTVTRLSGKGAARSRAELAKEAAEQITESVKEVDPFFDVAWKDPANKIKPIVRKLNWGVAGGVVAINRFSVKADEALVITLDPIGGKYLGIQVTDPWLRSVDYWNHSGSLSNRQAKPNADGSITYVLSSKDPGVHNWLDTVGLHDGDLIVRWEGVSPPAAVEKAVRETRVVKLSELASALPAGTPRVNAAERRQLLAARVAAYERRVSQ